MGYYDATDQIIAQNGGQNPICPVCKQTMYPRDDHGRFLCGCPGSMDMVSGHRLPTRAIPQVPASISLTDEQKEQIPAINRLNHPPTPTEQAILSRIFR